MSTTVKQVGTIDDIIKAAEAYSDDPQEGEHYTVDIAVRWGKCVRKTRDALKAMERDGLVSSRLVGDGNFYLWRLLDK